MNDPAACVSVLAGPEGCGLVEDSINAAATRVTGWRQVELASFDSGNGRTAEDDQWRVSRLALAQMRFS